MDARYKGRLDAIGLLRERASRVPAHTALVLLDVALDLEAMNRQEFSS